MRRAAGLAVQVTLEKLDAKWFPRTCCGVEYTNARRFMDHFLPEHMSVR